MKDYTLYIAKGLEQYGWQVGDRCWNKQTKESAIVTEASEMGHVTLARGRNFSAGGYAESGYSTEFMKTGWVKLTQTPK